MWKYYILYAE